MPNLKDIKSRIQSVQNTQKITKAMKMVAAAKVKRAESSVKASRPFSQQLLEMFRRMLATTGELDSNGKTFDKPLDNYPELLSKRDTIKTEGLVVVTSNKGLAGAYNANIVRTVLKKIEENSQNNVETLLYIVGQKGISALQHKQHVNIEKKYIAVADKPSSSAANMIAEDITEDYVSGKIDKIEIITTRFNNMMSYLRFFVKCFLHLFTFFKNFLHFVISSVTSSQSLTRNLILCQNYFFFVSFSVIVLLNTKWS